MYCKDMLRSKFFLTICVVTVILALVADHEVSATPVPEPCHGYGMPMKMKKPPMKKPEPKKEDLKKKKMDELSKLLKKLYPELFTEETTTPQPTTTTASPEMDTYMDLLGKLLDMYV